MEQSGRRTSGFTKPQVMCADTRTHHETLCLEFCENRDLVCSLPGTQWVSIKGTSCGSRPLRAGARVRGLQVSIHPTNVDEAFCYELRPEPPERSGDDNSVAVLKELRFRQVKMYQSAGIRERRGRTQGGAGGHLIQKVLAR